MIKIKPPAGKWKKKLKELSKTEDWSSFRDIKALREYLAEYFFHKCAYCEQPVAPGDGSIEHFKPKRLYPSLSLDISNMLFACRECNAMKADSFPVNKDGAPLLLNPYIDSPNKHLAYTGNGEVSPLSERGAATIKVLSLNRPKLVYLRRDLLNSILKNKNILSSKDVLYKLPFLQLLSYIFDIKVPPHPYIYNVMNRSTSEDNEVRFSKSIRGEDKKNIKPHHHEWKSEKFDYTDQNIFIKSLEIKNFKSISYAKIDLNDLRLMEVETENEYTLAPWGVLLGENGTGKSSILEAISLTLLGDNYQRILSELKIEVKDLLKLEESAGYVKIYFSHVKEPRTLKFSNKKGFKLTGTKPSTIVLGYGAIRVPRKRKVEHKTYKEKMSRGENIAGIFDKEVRLVNSSSWLYYKDDESFHYIEKDVIRKIIHLEPFQRLSKHKRLVDITMKPYNTSLKSISSGYKSLIALCCDILDNLLDIWSFTTNARGASGRFNTKNFSAIILIDEIGIHLHPSWKLRIVDTLREIFPRVQFIVSTHDPLCVRGTYRGEVFVLKSDSNNNTVIFDKDELPNHEGLSAEQILKSEFFGLASTRSPEIERKFKEYYHLLGLSKEEQFPSKERIKKLKDELTEFRLHGSDRSERLMLEAIDSYIATQAREEDKSKRIENKEALKDTLLRILEE